jgi:hypothetical protein
LITFMRSLHYAMQWGARQTPQLQNAMPGGSARAPVITSSGTSGCRRTSRPGSNRARSSARCRIIPWSTA